MNCPFSQYEWYEGMRLPICGLIPNKTCNHADDKHDDYSFARCVKVTMDEVA